MSSTVGGISTAGAGRSPPVAFVPVASVGAVSPVTTRALIGRLPFRTTIGIRSDIGFASRCGRFSL
jgi:hypothetical protein